MNLQRAWTSLLIRVKTPVLFIVSRYEVQPSFVSFACKNWILQQRASQFQKVYTTFRIPPSPETVHNALPTTWKAVVSQWPLRRRWIHTWEQFLLILRTKVPSTAQRASCNGNFFGPFNTSKQYWMSSEIVIISLKGGQRSEKVSTSIMRCKNAGQLHWRTYPVPKLWQQHHLKNPTLLTYLNIIWMLWVTVILQLRAHVPRMAFGMHF